MRATMGRGNDQSLVAQPMATIQCASYAKYIKGRPSSMVSLNKHARTTSCNEGTAMVDDILFKRLDGPCPSAMILEAAWRWCKGWRTRL